MFFPGTQIVQDRYIEKYSRGDVLSLIDNQQDFCIIQTNITNQNVYLSFERYSTTGDIYDINLTSNLYLTFSMGFYTLSNYTNNYFFRKSLESNINLINCISSKKNKQAKLNIII